jgi:hypothetical protein
MRYITDAKDETYKLMDEIRYAMRPEAERAGNKGLGLKGMTPNRGLREPDKSYLVNWVLARFFSMPRDQRDRFIEEGKAIADDHLRSDEQYLFAETRPFGLSVVVDEDSAAHAENIDPATGEPLGKPARAKGKRA